MASRTITIESQKGKFFIREFQPEDLSGCLDSWKAAFGKEMDKNLWEWKYFKSPGGFRTVVCVSEDGTVAVHYAGQGNRSFYFDKEILGLQLIDIYSHPSFRWAIGGKTGLFVKTARSFWQTFMDNAPFDKGLDLFSKQKRGQFVWGLPGIRHARLGQKVIKYGRLPDAFFAKSQIKKRQNLKGNLLYSLNRVIPSNDKMPRGLDRLWSRFLTKCKPFCIIKDKAHVKWRFWQCPKAQEHSYRFYLLKRPWSSAPLAWLAVATVDNRNMILDFLAVSEKDLARIVGMCIMEEDQPLEVWLSETDPLCQVFLQLGFLKEPEPLGIVPSMQSFCLGIMDKTDSFHWLMGDSDLF